LNSLLHVRIPDDIYWHVRLKRVCDEYSEREDEFDRLREAGTKKICKRQHIHNSGKVAMPIIFKSALICSTWIISKVFLEILVKKVK